MNKVIIAGIGQTPVGEHWDTSLRDLAVSAIVAAQSDSGGLQPDALFVGNMFAPILSDQAHLGALIADYAGLTGIEAVTLESGGASGGVALRTGYLSVASGMVDVALVLGVEKITDQIGPNIEAAAATGTDSDFESIHGIHPTGQAALLMQRYMHEFNVPHDAFAGFPITAHANSASNPNAMYRNPLTLEAYQTAGIIADPINMFDAAPLADGAAAVLLTRTELLPYAASHPYVQISGSSMANDRLALHDRVDLLSFPSVRASVLHACRKAGFAPGDIDFFELFDAYSIFSVLSLEAAGFAERGQGWMLAQDGKISREGLLPVATFGGLKARGHPGGATGIYQVVEASLQLRGEAGINQIPGATQAMIQCLGGAAATAVTHILELYPGQ